MRIFSEYLNTYAQQRDANPWERLFSSCYGASSVVIDNQLVSHFPACVYNGLEDLTQTILDPANCHTSKVTSFIGQSRFHSAGTCICLYRYNKT
jgi:hypothetical protein